MASDRAQTLLRELGEENVPAEDAATVERRRRRVVAATAMAIARAAKARETQRRWTRTGVAIAAAAAVILLAGGAWRARTALRSAPASSTPAALAEPIVGALHRTHKGEALPVAAALGAGDEVKTDPKGRAQVILASGVAITLQSDTRLRLPDAPTDSAGAAREEIRLASGAVDVHVPPMAPGHTFSVKTPDAEVTVHGTTFTVEVAPPPSNARPTPSGSVTRVHVTTGVVSVSSEGREAVLTAGMEWPEPKAAQPSLPVDATAAGSARPAGSAEPLANSTKSSLRPRRDEAAPATASKSSRLGEENQLLSTAIAASKEGDYAGAVATLNDLLRRFPSSTLAQEGHVERFRALAHGGDHAGAAREARQYLALYPEGFAREEARALAVGW